MRLGRLGRKDGGVPRLEERNCPLGLLRKLGHMTSHRPPGQALDPENEGSLFSGGSPATCAIYQKRVRVGGPVRRKTESRMWPFHVTEITPLSQWSGWQ